MKIGELFLALGFKVEGQDKLDDAERGMTKAGLKAGALAVAVNAVNYAFLRMVDAGRQAAVELKNFVGTTGLSADALQGFKFAGDINDVDGAEIISTIKAIQAASAEIRLGRGNIAPWQLLGISPNQDPFVILRQLREKLIELPPDIARVIAAQMGISDNVFQMLRATTLEFDRLEQRYRMTDREQKQLVSLNRAWKELLFSIKAVSNKFAAEFAPALAFVSRGLKMLLDLLASFVHWLGKGSTAARIIQVGLVILAGAMLILGAALAALVAVIGVATLAFIALDLAAAPIIVAVSAIAAVVLLLIGLLGTLVLLIQDFWTQADGGKSFFDWNENLILSVRNVERLAKAMEWLIEKGKQLKALGQGVVLAGMLGPAGLAQAAADRFGRGASTVKQENNVRVHVDGARDPKEVGRAVAESVTEAVSDAAYQMPIPNY